MDVLKGKVARELAAIEEQLDRALERSLGSEFRAGRTDRFRPAIDVYEAADAIFVQAELGGVRPEDVRLVVDGEYLQISGRRRTLRDETPRRQLQMEIPQGHFERVLRFRTAYDPDGVTASLDAGILKVRLPLRPHTTRTVPVKSRPRRTRDG